MRNYSSHMTQLQSSSSLVILVLVCRSTGSNLGSLDRSESCTIKFCKISSGLVSANDSSRNGKAAPLTTIIHQHLPSHSTPTKNLQERKLTKSQPTETTTNQKNPTKLQTTNHSCNKLFRFAEENLQKCRPSPTARSTGCSSGLRARLLPPLDWGC